MNAWLAHMVIKININPSKKSQLKELLAKRSYTAIMDNIPVFPVG